MISRADMLLWEVAKQLAPGTAMVSVVFLKQGAKPPESPTDLKKLADSQMNTVAYFKGGEEQARAAIVKSAKTKTIGSISFHGRLVAGYVLQVGNTESFFPKQKEGT